MKVYFVGAGPGAADLLTVRATRLIARAPVIAYTGSLVPREVLAAARPDAHLVDTKGLTLDEIVAIFMEARERDQDVVRLHTGDPTIFGAIAEQMRCLRRLGIPYEIVPGVTAATAAAAVLGIELTLPEVAQAVILARASGRTPVPPNEELAELGRHRSTLVLYLSAALVPKVVRELVPHYGADCPAAIVQRASWPEQRVVRGSLGELHLLARAAKIKNHAMILVGRVLDDDTFPDSRLYDPAFTHRYRRGRDRIGRGGGR